MKKKLFFLLIFIFIFTTVFTPLVSEGAETSVRNKEKLDVYFFHAPGCPYCAKEKNFLDEIEKEYSEINVERYSIANPENHDLLKRLVEEHDAGRFLGSVPMTFIEDDFFLGFSESIGNDIEESIKKHLENGAVEGNISTTTTNGTTDVSDEIDLPIAGKIDPHKYSLPILSVMLGFLDGFNVCSLGALVLILGLVITLKSRKKILSLGGLFIVTTAVIYGLLIVLWYQLFSALSSYMIVMRILVAMLGIGGGIFFLNEFKKYRKYGPQCETTGNKIVSRFSKKVEKAFQNKKGLLALGGIIFIFAAIITIVEFPCSAAVPVIFAGILAEQKLSAFMYLIYISIFVLFYMLDELVIFIIAVWKMDIWMASPKFVTWATLAEGIILITLGLYYVLELI